MSGLLVIGYGNRLRGDDAAGPAAAVRVGQLLPGAHVIVAHQLTPELADPVSRAGAVIFIDAAAEGEPGETFRIELIPGPPGSAFSHHVSPAGLLTLARVLYGAAAPATLYSIAAGNFEPSNAMTPAVQAAVEEVARLISEEWAGAL